MAESVSIKENSDLLKKIVAEKGFSGYKYRYYWILQELIDDNTIYEELSEENRAILHQETRLSKAMINSLSAIINSKDDIDDVGITQSTPKTNIGYILGLLPHLNYYQHNSLPEEKQMKPLNEYINLLSISINMFRLYSDSASDARLQQNFRQAIKSLWRKHCEGKQYHELLKLFDGNVTVDLSQYNIATRMEEMARDALDLKIPPTYATLWYGKIKEYHLYRGIDYSCQDVEAFCEICNYIDLSFPKRDIVAFLSSDKIYAELHSRLTNKEWNNLNNEELAKCSEKVKELIKKLETGSYNDIEISYDWKEILSAKLEELREEVENKLSNSKPKEYSLKQRLYLLKRFADDALKSKFATPRDKIYAILLDTSEDSVRAVSNQINHENLSYKNYNEQANNIIEMYNLAEALGDGVGLMLDQMEKDLIPKANTENQSLRKLEEHKFIDPKLRLRVISKISSYHEDKEKNDTK